MSESELIKATFKNMLSTLGAMLIMILVMAIIFLLFYFVELFFSTENAVNVGALGVIISIVFLLWFMSEYDSVIRKHNRDNFDKRISKLEKVRSSDD